MQFPSKVKIGNKIYTVKLVDDYVHDGKNLCYGVIDYTKDTIEISTLYAESTQFTTFLHEILHGIDEFLGIKLEEEQIDKLARGLAMLILDNPDLFEDQNWVFEVFEDGKKSKNEAKEESN